MEPQIRQVDLFDLGLEYIERTAKLVPSGFVRWFTVFGSAATV